LVTDSAYRSLQVLKTFAGKHSDRRSKADVAQWVIQVFPEDLGMSFALGLPIVILKLILTGVYYFANQIDDLRNFQWICGRFVSHQIM
jgi:hypothetical protein